MAKPSTVKAFWQQEQAGATEALTEAKSELSTTLQARARAQASLQAALLKVSNRRKAIEALWKGLPEMGAAGGAPAEAEADLGKIREAMVALLPEEAGVAAARGDTARLEAEAERLVARVREAGRRATEAAAGLARAETDHDKRQGRLQALAAAPLSGLPEGAKTLLEGADYAAARARIEAAIPAPLRQVAGARWKLEQERMEHERELAAFALEEFQKHLADDHGADGEVRRRHLDLGVADAVLEEFVLVGPERLSNAARVLKALDPDVSEASARELAEVPAGAAEAVTAVAELLVAQGTVEQRRLDLRKAEIQRDVNPSGARKAAVTKAKSRLSEAEAERDDKAATAASTVAVLRGWEVSVPDSAWRALGTLLQQTDILEGLADVDVDELGAAVSDAEKMLAGALVDGAGAARGEVQWTEFLQEVQARESAARAAFADRSMRSVRGACHLPGLENGEA